jgi:hypothetical protein
MLGRSYEQMMLVCLTPVMGSRIIVSLCRDGGARRRVTAALVTLHVASYAESFPTARLRTLVRFFARMAMAMDA